MKSSTHASHSGSAFLVGLTLVLSGFWIHSSAATPAPCGSAAGDIKVGVSYSARPYVFPRTDSGIQIDIMREALDRAGYRLCPVYLPALRAAQSFAERRLDALLNVSASRYRGFLSIPVISYQNCAYSLAHRNIGIDSLDDLADHAIVAFQGAEKLLEPEFADVVARVARYYEVADQEMQLRALYRQRVDVAVMEQRIFGYYRSHLTRQATDGTAQIPLAALRVPVREQCPFQPAAYRIEFADEAVRDAFNAGLQQLREAGAYRRIIQRYEPAEAFAQQ